MINIYQGIKKITRNKTQSNNEFFWFITNKLGYDVEICHNYYKNGEKFFSKWKSFLWLCQFEPNQYIPEIYMTRQEFIDKATHRSVIDIEIMIDIDEKGYCESIKDNATKICEDLNKKNLIYTCCFSGSKSYHISILIPKLREYNSFAKEVYKRKILGNYDGVSSDIVKASKRNMIALEGVKHWKTENIKQEVCLNE
jgi:hypothetical protein